MMIPAEFARGGHQPLTAARFVRLGTRFEFRLAAAEDDVEVRRLLREHPLPGRIGLTLEREPDAGLAAGIEGDVHQTLLAADARTGTVAGIASRVERKVFVNGRAVRLGYLGQLRVAAEARRRLRSIIDEGFERLRELHAAGGVPAYLTSHITDNRAARRLLVNRRSPTAPRYTPVGQLTTFVLPAGRRRSRGSIEAGASGRAGDAGGFGFGGTWRQEDHDQLVDCLQRNLSRFQFAPVWDAETLGSPSRMRGLSLADFIVVRRHARIAGCAALWDQRAFKQVVVRHYASGLRYWRPLLNLAAPLVGLPRLPPTGSPLHFGYISHLAVDGDDPGMVAELVSGVRARAATAGLTHVVVGAPAGHALASAIGRLGRHQRYETELFLACWPDGEGFVRSVGARPPMPEVAIL